MRTSNISGTSSPQRTIDPSDIDQILEVNDLDNLRPLRSALGANVKTASGFLIWNPETARITIYYERLASDNRAEFPYSQGNAVAARQSAPHLTPSHETSSRANENQSATGDVSEVTPLQIRQCCEALDEAEKANKPFIGLQWFRDHVLTARAYSWADSVTCRKDVLTKAIEVGAIITTPVPNPKDPQRPTTSIKLNRDSIYAQAVKPRFQPIRAKGGASASEIILRDRGRF